MHSIMPSARVLLEVVLGTERLDLRLQLRVRDKVGLGEGLAVERVLLRVQNLRKSGEKKGTPVSGDVIDNDCGSRYFQSSKNKKQTQIQRQRNPPGA